MPNCVVRLDPEYRGPTIVELADVIENITDSPIRVRWGNTRDEAAALRRHPGRLFTLCVPDFPARDRACATLGLPLNPEPTVLERAKILLRDPKAYDWRNFCDEQGKARGRPRSTCCSSSWPTP